MLATNTALMNDAPSSLASRSPGTPRRVAALLLLTLAFTASALGAGCTSSGVTPSCEAGAGGGDAGGGGSCNPKAICVNDANQQVDPSECCKDLSGSALESCLAGFEAGP